MMMARQPHSAKTCDCPGAGTINRRQMQKTKNFRQFFRNVKAGANETEWLKYFGYAAIYFTQRWI